MICNKRAEVSSLQVLSGEKRKHVTRHWVTLSPNRTRSGDLLFGSRVLGNKLTTDTSNTSVLKESQRSRLVGAGRNPSVINKPPFRISLPAFSALYCSGPLQH